MKLYLDTEFNGFGAELISIALVDENDHYFYEELQVFEPHTKWVQENVVPKLIKPKTTTVIVRKELVKFLNQYDDVDIYADWPEDIKHVCDLIMRGPGVQFSVPYICFHLAPFGNIQSESPHNALEDARALKRLLNED